MVATHRQTHGAEQVMGGATEGTTGDTQWTTAQLTLIIEFVPADAQPAQAASVQEAEPASATYEVVEEVPAPPPRGSRKRPAPRRRKAGNQGRAKHKALPRPRTSKKAPSRSRSSAGQPTSKKAPPRRKR